MFLYFSSEKLAVSVFCLTLLLYSLNEFLDTCGNAYPEEMKREFYANKSATGKLVRMYEVK